MSTHLSIGNIVPVVVTLNSRGRICYFCHFSVSQSRGTSITGVNPPIIVIILRLFLEVGDRWVGRESGQTYTVSRNEFAPRQPHHKGERDQAQELDRHGPNQVTTYER